VLSRAMAKVGCKDAKGELPGCSGEIEMIRGARLVGCWCSEKMTGGKVAVGRKGTGS
jgi:hypothetical protein